MSTLPGSCSGNGTVIFSITSTPPCLEKLRACIVAGNAICLVGVVEKCDKICLVRRMLGTAVRNSRVGSDESLGPGWRRPIYRSERSHHHLAIKGKAFAATVSWCTCEDIMQI